MSDHEEDVNDCTMCVCGTPLELCADYWAEPDFRLNQRKDRRPMPRTTVTPTKGSTRMLNTQNTDVEKRTYPPIPATAHQKITAPVPVVRKRLPFAPWRFVALAGILAAATPCGIAAAAPIVNGADIAVAILIVAFIAIFAIPGKDM